jgi:hypothetical protein
MVGSTSPRSADFHFTDSGSGQPLARSLRSYGVDAANTPDRKPRSILLEFTSLHAYRAREAIRVSRLGGAAA